MRIGVILMVVAACAVAAACSKKSSLYLVPGRAAEAAAKPAPKSASPATPVDVQKASEVDAPAAPPAQR